MFYTRTRIIPIYKIYFLHNIQNAQDIILTSSKIFDNLYNYDCAHHKRAYEILLNCRYIIKYKVTVHKVTVIRLGDCSYFIFVPLTTKIIIVEFYCPWRNC